MSVAERASILLQEIAAYRDQVKATRARLFDLGLILVRCECELRALRYAAPDAVSDLIEDAALIEDASSQALHRTKTWTRRGIPPWGWETTP